MLEGLLTNTAAEFNMQTALVCSIVSLLLGLVIAVLYMLQDKNYSKNYIITLALLPAMVQVVIMLVNGNLGTSVAVMGAFSLVRFRSMPGNAKEIATLFFAVVVGLATGMGYITYACLITAMIGLAMLVLTKSGFGERKELGKELKITIPDHLEYDGLFDDLFAEYTNRSELFHVKTTNMGSMYELQYHIELKDDVRTKQFIDAIRCRNGNLPIICGRRANRPEEL